MDRAGLPDRAARPRRAPRPDRAAALAPARRPSIPARSFRRPTNCATESTPKLKRPIKALKALLLTCVPSTRGDEPANLRLSWLIDSSNAAASTDTYEF